VLIFGRKLGAALTRAGQHADAEGVLREALDIAEPTGRDRAQVLEALAHVARNRGRGTEAIGYIEQAIGAAEKSGERELLSSLTDTRRAWAS
jgi:tetratricopeptide (TPR) repeat protein